MRHALRPHQLKRLGQDSSGGSDTVFAVGDRVCTSHGFGRVYEAPSPYGVTLDDGLGLGHVMKEGMVHAYDTFLGPRVLPRRA